MTLTHFLRFSPFLWVLWKQSRWSFAMFWYVNTRVLRLLLRKRPLNTDWKVLRIRRLAAPLRTRSNSRTEISRAGSWVLVLNGRGTCTNQNDTWPPRLRLSTWPDRILSGQFRFLKGGELNFCDFESADWTNTEKPTEIIVVAERGIWKSLFFRALRDTTTKQLGFARYI